MQQTSSSKPNSGGSIIMTASVAGLRSGAGSPDYSASKAAVISLAQTASWENRGRSIRVNAVCPGLIETGMTTIAFDMAKANGTLGKIGQLNPTSRYGVAEEVSSACVRKCQARHNADTSRILRSQTPSSFSPAMSPRTSMESPCPSTEACLPATPSSSRAKLALSRRICHSRNAITLSRQLFVF